MAYLVGGFFGFIKKAFKGVARVVGKGLKVVARVGGVGLGLASALVPGPAGKLVAGLGGIVGRVAGGGVARSVGRGLDAYRSAAAGLSRTDLRFGRILPGGMPVLRAFAKVPGYLNKTSAVMPGGSVATVPSLRRPAVKRKRKASPKRRKSVSRRKGKLKFGSPAYRKKYLGHR